jgi:hypothetical protein
MYLPLQILTEAMVEDRGSTLGDEYLFNLDMVTMQSAKSVSAHRI